MFHPNITTILSPTRKEIPLPTSHHNKLGFPYQARWRTDRLRTRSTPQCFGVWFLPPRLRPPDLSETRQSFVGSKRKLGTLLAGKLGRSPSPFGMQIIAFQKVGQPGRGYVFLGKSFEFHTLCIRTFFWHRLFLWNGFSHVLEMPKKNTT